MNITAAFIAFFSLLACGGSGGASANSTTIAEPPNTRLGVGDVFEVRVYGEEELTSSYRVAETGDIDFPFIGKVKVEGLAPPEVADSLATQLVEGQFFKDPQISIFVTDYASKKISIVGAVQKPGAFPMTTGLTVIQAVSLAGGFTSLASQNSVVITRTTKEGRRRISAKAQDISEGDTDDIPLQAGDIVYVPERVF